MASTEDSPFSTTASDYRKIWGFKKISITFDQLRELWDKGLCSADTNRQLCLTTLWNKKGFLHLGECGVPLTLFHKPCLVFNIRSITVLHNNFGAQCCWVQARKRLQVREAVPRLCSVSTSSSVLLRFHQLTHNCHQWWPVHSYMLFSAHTYSNIVKTADSLGHLWSLPLHTGWF